MKCSNQNARTQMVLLFSDSFFGVYEIIDDKIIEIPFNENNVANNVDPSLTDFINLSALVKVFCSHE